MEQQGRCQSDKIQQGVRTSDPTRQSSEHISRRASWGTATLLPSTLLTPDNQSQKQFESVDLQTNVGEDGTSYGIKSWDAFDNIFALGLSFHAEESEGANVAERHRMTLSDADEDEHPLASAAPPFNKWLKTLHKNGHRRRKTSSSDDPKTTINGRVAVTAAMFDGRRGHKKSSSGSSLGFVTAVKSASISLASFSLAPRSRATARSRHNRTDRSSRASNVGRFSEDDSYLEHSLVMDQEVTNRLLQRRRVLEEIISTEEAYVADIKFLMNVYVTLLASVPSLSLHLRSSINRNLGEIVELHDEILGDLHRIVPHSEYTQNDYAEPIPTLTVPGHHRWRSLNAVPEDICGSLWLQKIPGMTAEPRVAAKVAKSFAKKIHRFFIYEEYGAKYEMMIKDIASTPRTMPQWESYQKGLEALGSSLASINAQVTSSRKAMTVGDLLVKPIQRVCKYPLLFAELLKHTPVCDCPESYSEIEGVLLRLREATAKINHAKEDPGLKAVMEKTWLLQDRLTFPGLPKSRSKSAIRVLGHVHLCGVLHASWQTAESVEGSYFICLAYRDYLLLASATKADQGYVIQACISLSQIRVEDVDNGLQCHTAPFSWKIVFEIDHQLFELTLSACSSKEEAEWRGRLTEGGSKHNHDSGEQAVSEMLSLSVKSLGTVFGKPGTIARRLSIHRATTVGPTSGLCQVIIRNTNAFKDIPRSSSSASINRSQSVLMTNRIPILAPSRAERIRLENLVSDIWTREVLPFPGMTGRARSEHNVRASASSMMRKLSVASIASNFTKRSGSLASLYKAAEEDAFPDAEPKLPRRDYNYSETDATTLETAPSYEEKPVSSPILDSDDGLSHQSSSASLRRLATLKFKAGWGPDGQRIVTPPLRTSSANSAAYSKPSAASTLIDIAGEDKENNTGSQTDIKQLREKKSKGAVRNRLMAEGIWNFFR
ncbi:Dbl-containing protein [Coleophoma crateriformis]|uniref:Dbl-containing protein n=1 Tax=Coleophoma crateriformis TaxID=565419 RepID=A0A3D8RVU0_9HELO|nr:Dbl-containing protein [Coleophoma crateriformis]